MSTLMDNNSVVDMIIRDHISTNHENSSRNCANAAIEEKEVMRQKQAYYKPTAESAAKAKALINFLMQDRFFLALLRSNDPKVRTAALEELNKAHYQAYGDAPIKDSAQA